MSVDAMIVREAQDWQMGTVRLLVRERRGLHMSYLQSDGTWMTVEEGTRSTNAGIALPAEAVDAIAEAVATFQGTANHAATEAAVLREWLAVERGRVDEALKQR